MNYTKKLSRIFALKEQGRANKFFKKEGFWKICSIMNIEKFGHSARGGKWHSRTIKYMLENPLYKGTAHYKDNKVKNKELALV